MKAKIIVVANQKGGCGKTTLTMNISSSLAKDKKKVLVIDGDQQGTATAWAKNAEDDLPFPCTVISLASTQEKAHREIAKFVNDYDYIIVDCPPSVDNRFNDSVLIIADLVIIPIVPSPADLWAAVGIKNLINKIKETREIAGIQEPMHARLVANMCQKGVSMSSQALDAIETFGIPKCDTNIYLRTSFRQSLINGTTVLNSNDEKAATEINKLTKEIKSILK